MNTKLHARLLLSSVLLLPLAYSAGCGHVESHKESDKPNWTGGRTHEETTVYRNADGSKSVSHEKQSTH